jgi:hypothetical protein
MPPQKESPAAVTPSPHGKYHVKPLATNTGYNLWSIRVTAILTERKEWNEPAGEPSDSVTATNFLIGVIDDDFLEQFLDTDLKPLHWAYFKKTILVSTISAQSTALTSLFAFNLGEANLVFNLTTIKELQRNLTTAFSNSEKISISLVNLVTLFALVNMPSEYAALRTTLEETTKQLNLDELFKSLIREESRL